MEQIRDFLAMGGHGAFVWPAYAIALAVLIAMAVHAWLARRALRRRIDGLPRRTDGR